MKYFCLYLVIINVLTFVMYFIDKFKSTRNWWRTPEKALLFMGLIGGCAGGIIGMNVFRHKTKKLYFYVINYLCLIIWVGCIIFFISKK